MLGMARIRALEVATFYFMFQLQPVGSVAHIQVCGTTSCLICGAEDLIGVCKEKIAVSAHALSADGKFSWEEVECLGACANAPMVQIGKDYYEDLTADRLSAIIDELAAGKVPTPGPQNGRYACEPLSGLTSLTEYDSGRTQFNASAQLATDIGDTVKRIDGTEVPLLAPWGDQGGRPIAANAPTAPTAPKPAVNVAADETGVTKQEAPAKSTGKPVSETPADAPLVKPSTALAGQAELAARKGSWKYEGGATTKAAKPAAPAPKPAAKSAPAPAEGPGKQPEGLPEARGGTPDDLKMIKGVGPKLEDLLNELGFFHFDQVAGWGAEEVAWVDQNLKGFKGRVSRDNWVEQATALASGAETEFSKRAKKEDIYKDK